MSNSNNAQGIKVGAKAATAEEEAQHTRCIERLDLALSRNAEVKKLMESIEQLGCTIPNGFFECWPCQNDISGGFSVGGEGNKAYVPKVVVCQNKHMESETFESTMVHELVHAYDTCRSKIDFSDCAQHACTEIRAAALSGECRPLHELFRGNIKFGGGYADCVKRRAALSISMNPHCQKDATAVVDSVFKKCYMDSKPFDPKF